MLVSVRLRRFLPVKTMVFLHSALPLMLPGQGREGIRANDRFRVTTGHANATQPKILTPGSFRPKAHDWRSRTHFWFTKRGNLLQRKRGISFVHCCHRKGSDATELPESEWKASRWHFFCSIVVLSWSLCSKILWAHILLWWKRCVFVKLLSNSTSTVLICCNNTTTLCSITFRISLTSNEWRCWTT